MLKLLSVQYNKVVSITIVCIGITIHNLVRGKIDPVECGRPASAFA